MALRSALGTFGRLTQEVRARGAAAEWRRGAAGGCTPSGAPPPCPCGPRVRPPCRARPAARAPALRAACRAPPQGRRPPCPPCPVPPPLSCDNRLSTNARKGSRACGPFDEIGTEACSTECGLEGDRVARRLARAERARRADYERETAERNARVRPAPPPAPYSPGDQRECARAADGRRVEVLPDGDCRIRDGEYLDPCAHRPRVLLEVKRDAPLPAPPAAHPSPNPPAPRVASPKSTKKFTSRIFETFTTKRTGTGASCPRSSCGEKCDDESDRTVRRGPAPAPPPCRQPTIVEKLRGGRPGACKDESGTQTRKLHTSVRATTEGSSDKGKADPAPNSAADSIAEKMQSDFHKLESMLNDRKLLKDAGRGRVVYDEDHERSYRVTDRKPVTGQLDIPVPAGADAVLVRVLLRPRARADCSARAGAGRTDGCGAPTQGAASDPCECASPTNKCESWLSIKNLQKKLSGSKSTDNTEDKSPCTPRPPPPRPSRRCPCPCRSPPELKKSPEGTERCSPPIEFETNSLLITT